MVGIATSATHRKKGKAIEEKYRRLTPKERKEIEKGLTRGDSFRGIAQPISRSPLTASREVRKNRHVRELKVFFR